MNVNFISNIGFILLAVYLLLIGIASIIPVFALPSILMGILAIAAGVCILIGK